MNGLSFGLDYVHASQRIIYLLGPSELCRKTAFCHLPVRYVPVFMLYYYKHGYFPFTHKTRGTVEAVIISQRVFGEMRGNHTN